MDIQSRSEVRSTITFSLLYFFATFYCNISKSFVYLIWFDGNFKYSVHHVGFGVVITLVMLFSLPKMCWESQAGKAFYPTGSRTCIAINHAPFSIKGMTPTAAVGDSVSPIRYRVRVAYINSWRGWESWNNVGMMIDKTKGSLYESKCK